MSRFLERQSESSPGRQSGPVARDRAAEKSPTALVPSRFRFSDGNRGSTSTGTTFYFGLTHGSLTSLYDFLKSAMFQISFSDLSPTTKETAS